MKIYIERKTMTPNYKITEEILNLVQKISELATQLSFETRELHLRKENRIRSIQSSLAIENNSLSLEQVTDIIEGKRVLGPLKDIHEVQNAYEAYEKVFRLNPYSIDDFLLAHQLLTQDLVKHPGQFRLGDVGVFDGSGKVVHLGARPQFVPNLVSDLFAWAKASQISDIVKSCIVHFELEIIHPFEDGNGRMGRMWHTLLLAQWKELFFWLPVEELIQARQQKYYDALGTADAQADCAEFVELMLEIVRDALSKVTIVSHGSDQDGDQDTDQDKTAIQRLLSVLGNDTLSAAELMKRLHLSHRPTFRKNYLHPALEQNQIERTLPDKPNSKNQKYRKHR